jgi:hypothetical protein
MNHPSRNFEIDMKSDIFVDIAGEEVLLTGSGVCPAVVGAAEDIRDKLYAITVKVERIGECLYTWAKQVKPPLWSKKSVGDCACQMCTSAGRPCLRITERGILLLPLVSEVRKDDLDTRGFWQRSKKSERDYMSSKL